MRIVAALLAALLVSSCAGGFGRPGARGASAAAGGTTSAAAAPCTSAADGETASGGMSCRAGTYYRCSNGAWQETALSCSR